MSGEQSADESEDDDGDQQGEQAGQEAGQLDQDAVHGIFEGECDLLTHGFLPGSRFEVQGIQQKHKCGDSSLRSE